APAAERTRGPAARAGAAKEARPAAALPAARRAPLPGLSGPSADLPRLQLHGCPGVRAFRPPRAEGADPRLRSAAPPDDVCPGRYAGGPGGGAAARRLAGTDRCPADCPGDA